MTDTHSPADLPADDLGAVRPPTLRTTLRERRAAAQAKLHLDRKVPRIDPPIWVRFQPIPGHTLDQIQKNLDKSKDPERTTIQNAVALANACVGIYQEALPDEDPVAYLHDEDPDDPKAVGLVRVDPDADDDVRFDAQLAEILGEKWTGSATAIVRALYLTDGDIVSEAGEVTVWSGFARRDGDEDYSGN